MPGRSHYSTRDGAPLLPLAPFSAWLAGVKREGGGYFGDGRPAPLNNFELGRRLGVHERRVRDLLGGTSRSPMRVTERLVERWGIALADDPNLADRLYPCMILAPHKGERPCP